MKQYKSVLLFSLCMTFATAIFAQVAEEKYDKRLSISSFSINSGLGFSMEVYGGDLGKFQKLAPSSELLDRDFSDFSKRSSSSLTFYDDRVYPAIGAYVFFDWRTKNSNFKKLNPQLIFGVHNIQTEVMQMDMLKEEHFIVDSLYSYRDNMFYLVDSIYSERYNLQYSSRSVYVNSQFLIGSNPDHFFRIYGGIGVSLGISIDNWIKIERSAGENLNTEDLRFSFGDNIKRETEKYDAPSGISALFSIPIGVEARFSKERPFWKHLNFILEYRQSTAYNNYKNLGDRFTSINTFNYGVKYRL